MKEWACDGAARDCGPIQDGRRPPQRELSPAHHRGPLAPVRDEPRGGRIEQPPCAGADKDCGPIQDGTATETVSRHSAACHRKTVDGNELRAPRRWMQWACDGAARIVALF